MVEKLKENINSCPNRGLDDLDLSECLSSVGVSIGDSRDEHGLERFHSQSFEFHYFNPAEQGFSRHIQ